MGLTPMAGLTHLDGNSLFSAVNFFSRKISTDMRFFSIIFPDITTKQN
jgi:hypothetical protein